VSARGVLAKAEHAVKSPTWGCQMCGQCVLHDTGLHFISFRKDAGIAKLCGRLGIPSRIERESNGYSASVALG